MSILRPGYTIRYLFIDLKDPDYGSDPSLVVELTYNNTAGPGCIEPVSS